MNLFPGIEARVSAQERRQTHLEAQVEELSGDTMRSYKQISEYLGNVDDHLDKIENRLDKIEGDITLIKAEMAAMEGRIKAEMAAMEGRILEAFKQLLAVVTPLPQ